MPHSCALADNTFSVMLIPGEEPLIKGDTGDVAGKLLKRVLAWGSLNR